ncbi:MAG TPA: mandelate racemase/muconate lactonizing enzyme family protein [Methylomirabilota bacterium]|jgi:D-arabinonate dehydratase|nr:mandelate racemase/muconate lactonizing enzyme family protein [Methylomirabilota bacterium]
MKITAIESFVLRVPTPHPIALEFAEHKLVVANIQTDEGLTGLGYSLAFGGGGAEAIQVYLESRLKPVLLGEDPLFVERLWERMYRADRGIKRQGVAGYALSALDIGLWDLAGRAARLPLYKMWGAVTDRVAVYGSGGWPAYSVDELVAEARRYVDMGCRYYKMKIHHPDPRVNRQRVEAVRKAVGEGVRLMVDVNQKLDVLGNIRQAQLLEDLDLVWYEEPVLADDIAACAEVARAIRIPVATGENNYTRFEFRELIERRAARYLMPDVCRANGFSETLKIGHLAAAHQVAVSPHVVHELSLHVVGALSNGFLVEFIDWTPPDLFVGLPRCEDGHFRIPDRPGHGIALAPDAARKYRV